MKIETTKREIQYTLTLDEDEATLLVSVLANQTGGSKNRTLQNMYDALANAGVNTKAWRKVDDYYSNLYVKVDQ